VKGDGDLVDKHRDFLRTKYLAVMDLSAEYYLQDGRYRFSSSIDALPKGEMTHPAGKPVDPSKVRRASRWMTVGGRETTIFRDFGADRSDPRIMQFRSPKSPAACITVQKGASAITASSTARDYKKKSENWCHASPISMISAANVKPSLAYAAE